MFKNINWKNIAVIAVVGVVLVPIIYSFAKPLLQKVPVIGSYYA